VTDRFRTTHVVVDTDALSWALNPSHKSYGATNTAIAGRKIVVSFVSITEVRFGALRAGWGEFRQRQLARRLADLDVVQTDSELNERCAQLRSWAASAGHALGQKIHEADRWVATTALALDLELVAGEQIFGGVPDLDVIPIVLRGTR